MNNPIFITFLVTALTLLFIGGFFYCRVERRLQILEQHSKHQAIPTVLLSIERFVKIIAVVAVLFCVGATVHYLCVFYPRFTTIDDHKNYVSSIGVDYWGVIVGFFTLLVTLLVGWQIFSNIRERERFINVTNENKQFQNDINDSYDKLESRIRKMEKCCIQRKRQIKELNSKVEYMSNATLLILSAKGLLKSANFENKEKRTDAYLVSSAYSTLYQALYQFICAKSDIRNVKGCISELKTCIMMLSFDNLQFIKEHYDRASELYNDIKSRTINKEILSDLNEINEAQEKISWNKDFEKMREFLGKQDNTNNNQTK